MKIQSFYPPRYFEKNQSRTLLVILFLLWVFLLMYFMIKRRDAPFLLVLWTVFCIYNSVGIAYMLKNGLYRQKGKISKKPVYKTEAQVIKEAKKIVGAKQTSK